MGEILNLDCRGCGAAGKDVWVGRGMLSTMPFEHRLYRCEPWSLLQSARVAMRLRDLREIAAGRENDGPGGELPASPRELAQLFVDFSSWPTCERCRGRLTGQSRRAEQTPMRCPGCGEELEVEELGNWD